MVGIMPVTSSRQRANLYITTNTRTADVVMLTVAVAFSENKAIVCERNQLNRSADILKACLAT